MPNALFLYRLSDPTMTPLSLLVVDAEIAHAVGERVVRDHSCRDWYPTIGLLLEHGKDWNAIRAIFNGEVQPIPDELREVIASLVPVLDHMASTYGIGVERTAGETYH